MEAFNASSLFSSPSSWAAMTAPPVAMAVNTLISRILSVSTREIPETAVSPTPATMIVSAIPTKTARNCSMISGRISRLMAAFENIGASSISLSLLYTALRLLMTVSKHSEDSSVCRVILFV